jgi:predicted lysophospholipase L1 biosynthesis ABC-type transport system permease subunit
VIDKDSVVVNQTLANQLFPRQNPVGQQLELGGGQHPRSVLIIGVARDSKYRTLGESPTPFLYGVFRPGFEGPAGTTVLVRTSGAPQLLIPAIRRQVRALDKNLPVTGMETMTEQIQSALWLARTLGAFFAVLGVAGTLLAMVGLYGSVAYSVARRTNEVGIRMAVGAQQRDVLKLVVGEGLFLALSGIGAGLVLAFLLTRFLRSLLYGVSPTDPLALSAVSILFMLVALAACYIPARRATKVDPMAALRHE